MATVAQTGKVDTPAVKAQKAKKAVAPLIDIMRQNILKGVRAGKLSGTDLEALAQYCKDASIAAAFFVTADKK